MLWQPTYHFDSEWRLPASPAKVWQALAAEPLTWDEWWPQLESMRLLTPDNQTVGARYACVWHANGYHLRNEVTISSLTYAKSLVLKSSGDLVGKVTCQLSSTPQGSQLTMQWQIKTSKRWMNLLAPLLKPIFTLNHHAVMRSGEKNLQRLLQSQKARN